MEVRKRLRAAYLSQTKEGDLEGLLAVGREGGREGGRERGWKIEDLSKELKSCSIRSLLVTFIRRFSSKTLHNPPLLPPSLPHFLALSPCSWCRRWKRIFCA